MLKLSNPGVRSDSHSFWRASEYDLAQPWSFADGPRCRLQWDVSTWPCAVVTSKVSSVRKEEFLLSFLETQLKWAFILKDRGLCLSLLKNPQALEAQAMRQNVPDHWPWTAAAFRLRLSRIGTNKGGLEAGKHSFCCFSGLLISVIGQGVTSKLKERRIRLDVRRGVVRHCNRLPRGIVDAPSLEALKARMDGALSDLC